jgi:hypothetical protein
MRRFNPNTLTHAEFYRGMFGRGAVTSAMREAAEAAEAGHHTRAARDGMRDAGIPMRGDGCVGGSTFDDSGNLHAA